MKKILLKKTSEINKSEVIQFFCENLIIQKDHQDDMMKCINSFFQFQFYYNVKINTSNSIFLLSLANIYLDIDLKTKQDYLKALKLYEMSAKENNSDAIVNIGLFYLNGYGVEKDFLKAKEQFEIGAKMNNSNGFLNLGILYANGFGVKKIIIKQSIILDY